MYFSSRFWYVVFFFNSFQVNSDDPCEHTSPILAVRSYDRGIYCFGVLLHAKWAITLTECVERNMKVTVFPETNKDKTRWVWMVYKPPEYENLNLPNSISVLRLYGWMTADDHVHYAPLPESIIDKVEEYCPKGVLTNWGYSADGMPVARSCTEVYLNETNASCGKVLESFGLENTGMCGTVKNLCKSVINGSPVICKETGVVLGLMPMYDTYVCKDNNDLGAFVRIDKYVDFVKKSMGLAAAKANVNCENWCLTVLFYVLWSILR